MFILLSILSFNASASAQTSGFTPVIVDTMDYKIWKMKPKPVEHFTACRMETRLNEAADAIVMNVGVMGSDYDYFGWDMPIPLSDFPLQAGYHHEYRVPGMAKMNLDYNGTTLLFSLVKRTPVYTMIFPFSLEIDPSLTTPKTFKGEVSGFEKDVFGRPLKKVTEECHFNP